MVALGTQRVDVTTRALVMGILNRTKDSFYGPAATYDLDAFFQRAERLVDEGADLLDVGGVKAGPGDTWRASVARAGFAAGAVVGNDISGFADPQYLKVAANAHASVVATHIRLRPRVADPTPTYDDVTKSVTEFLLERRRWAREAGLSEEQIVLDAGLDLGKTPAQSLRLLRDTNALAALGSPLLLSASNKTFLGAIFDLEVDQRREASLAATAIGIALGCRIVRVHDVAGAVRVRDTLASVAEAR